MRRWVCIIALLAGFSGTDYTWSSRPRIPIPIERVMPRDRRDPAVPGIAWWLRA